MFAFCTVRVQNEMWKLKRTWTMMLTGLVYFIVRSGLVAGAGNSPIEAASAVTVIG